MSSPSPSPSPVDQMGRTPLFRACQEGNFAKAQNLLESCPEDLNRQDEDGWTPIRMSVEIGHLKLVKFLFAHGADISIADDRGNTCIHVGSVCGHLKCVEFLYTNGADINRTNDNGATPFWIAAFGEKPLLLQFLYDNGADVQRPSNSKTSPWDIACKKNNSDVMRWFIYHANEAKILTSHLKQVKQISDVQMVQHAHYNLQVEHETYLVFLTMGHGLDKLPIDVMRYAGDYLRGSNQSRKLWSLIHQKKINLE